MGALALIENRYLLKVSSMTHCVSTQPMPDFSAVLPRLEPYGKIGVSKIIPQVNFFQTMKIMIADDDVDERCDNWKRLS